VAVAVENARLYEAVQQELLERKKAEDGLRESEEYYRVLTETASDAIVTVDSESRIHFVNHATQRFPK